MSVGFGAFAGGAADGYAVGKSIKDARQQREREEEETRRKAEEMRLELERKREEEKQKSEGQQSQVDLNQIMNQFSGGEAAGTAAPAANGGGASGAMVTGGPGTGTAASYGSFGLPAYGAGAGTAGSAAGGGGTGFGLGGSLVGGSGTVGGSTFAAGGASGSGGAGGAAAAGGPWAALAAVVIGNEVSAKNGGHRNSGTQYAKDLIGGKVFEQDADRLGNKIDSGNKIGIQGDWQVAGDVATLDFSNAASGLKDTTGMKLLRKIF